MQFKTMIIRSGFVQGGPRLAQLLRDKQEEWDSTFAPQKKHLRNQQPKKRIHPMLRWIL